MFIDIITDGKQIRHYTTNWMTYYDDESKNYILYIDNHFYNITENIYNKLLMVNTKRIFINFDNNSCVW